MEGAPSIRPATFEDFKRARNTIVPISVRGTIVTLRVNHILKIPKILNTIRDDYDFIAGDPDVQEPQKLFDMYYFDGCLTALHEIINFLERDMDILLVSPRQHLEGLTHRLMWWGMRPAIAGASDGRLWVDYNGDLTLIHYCNAEHWLHPRDLRSAGCGFDRSVRIFKNYDSIGRKRPAEIDNCRHRRSPPRTPRTPPRERSPISRKNSDREHRPRG